MSAKVPRNTEPALDPAQEKPLVDMELMSDIQARITALVGEDRSRATRLLAGENNFPAFLTYPYLLIPEEEEEKKKRLAKKPVPEKKDKIKAYFHGLPHPNAHLTQFPVPIQEVFAMCVRESLRQSALPETKENVLRIMDFVINVFFSGVPTSGDIEAFSSANQVQIEQALLPNRIRVIPTIRGAITILFQDRHAGPVLDGHFIIQPPSRYGPGDFSQQKALRVKIEQSLERAIDFRRDYPNHFKRIYTMVDDPKMFVKVSGKEGKEKKIRLLDLIIEYVYSARRSTHEQTADLEPSFDSKQISRSFASIIGRQMVSSKERIPKKVLDSIANNINTSVDPLVSAAVNSLLS
jgi:hypothetical protein